MVKKKKGFLLLIIGLLLSAYSCNYSDVINNKIPTDVTIKVFKISNTDTFKWTVDSSFAVDHIKRKIYNRDSLPFGSVLPRIFNFTITPYSYSSITIEDASGVRPYRRVEDSINVTKPFKVTIKGIDSLISITYDVQINIRQANPDTLNWTCLTKSFYSGNIYAQKAFIHRENEVFVFVNSGLKNFRLSSPLSDGINWATMELGNLPPTARIESMAQLEGVYIIPTNQNELYISTDGSVWSKRDVPMNILHVYGAVLNSETNRKTLIVLGEKGGLRTFFYSENGIDWINTNLEPTINFPVSGSTSITFMNSGYERLSVLGGVNKAGIIINDVYQMFFDKGQFRLSNNLIATNVSYTPRDGASVMSYGDKWWWIIGGRTAPYEYSKEIFESPDNGFSWTLAKENILFPAQLDTRQKASVLVDKHNYVWIIGGNNRLQHRDVWKGAVTRMIK